VDDRTAALRLQVSRQVEHWTLAAARMRELETFASAQAWAALERYLGAEIRARLLEGITGLESEGTALRSALDTARTAADLHRTRRHLVAFRARYLRTETTLDFFGDAINTRTNPRLAALLRACDVLAGRSIFGVLDPCGQPTPLVLTYLDRGLGASILKAGSRLWDGHATSPAAAIKVVPHNLYRPTALVHEGGHQAAAILGWNEELGDALYGSVSGAGAGLARIWAGWASEIAADAVAFVHTGYAAVAGLHDVLAGDPAALFRYLPGDPHPIAYIRVLLGVAACRRFYGAGPWDDLAEAWREAYPLDGAGPAVRAFVERSEPLLPRIVEASLCAPMRAFGGRSLAALVDPDRVRPQALLRLADQVGPALFTSPHWVFTEALRLLALTGYQVATAPERAREILTKQEEWMLRLGATLQVAA
jgi:hypothetical protein